MHMDIREDLTREISDRESASVIHIKQTFVSRESDPVFPLSDYLHTLPHIGEDDNFYQVENLVLFIWWDCFTPS